MIYSAALDLSNELKITFLVLKVMEIGMFSLQVAPVTVSC